MQATEFPNALREGRRVYGTLIVSDSPHWPGVVKGLGLDFVFIDAEHIALDRKMLSWMCRTYAALDLPPLVRIPAIDPDQATMALDGGAAGIVAPYVETAEQVVRLAGAVKMRPLKGLRQQQRLSKTFTPNETLAGYLEQRNAGHTLVVNVESVPSMEALDALLAIEALDGVLIGPHDLSTSLQVPEDYRHPSFISAVDEIIARTRAAGKGVGVHVFYDDLEQESKWIAQGANLVVHGADIISFRSAMQRDIRQLRETAGDEASLSSRRITI